MLYVLPYEGTYVHMYVCTYRGTRDHLYLEDDISVYCTSVLPYSVVSYVRTGYHGSSRLVLFVRTPCPCGVEVEAKAATPS